MAIFKPGIPVVTREPVVEVTANREFPLKTGRYRFQLVVEDDAGNVSGPDIVDVMVADAVPPRELPGGSGGTWPRRAAAPKRWRSVAVPKTKKV